MQPFDSLALIINAAMFMALIPIVIVALFLMVKVLAALLDPR